VGSVGYPFLKIAVSSSDRVLKGNKLDLDEILAMLELLRIAGPTAFMKSPKIGFWLEFR